VTQSSWRYPAGRPLGSHSTCLGCSWHNERQHNEKQSRSFSCRRHRYGQSASVSHEASEFLINLGRRLSLITDGVRETSHLFQCVSVLQRVSIACYAERCISYDRFSLTVRSSDRPTVCLTVRHTLVSCQNDSSYDRAVFTGR